MKIAEMVEPAILSKLSLLYMFPRIEEYKVNTTLIDSFYPYYWFILNKPTHLHTTEEVKYLKRFESIIEGVPPKSLHAVNNASNRATLHDLGVLPDTFYDEVITLKARLSELNIDFLVAGVGGAGMNALEVLKYLNPCMYEDDDLTLFDLLRMPIPLTASGSKLAQTRLTRQQDSFLSVEHLDPNERYLVYSSVEHGELKNALSDMPNVIQVNVGFTGNIGGAGLNQRQPIVSLGYGNVDAGVLKVNAIETAYKTVQYFNSLTDAQIEATFMLTKDIVSVNAIESGYLPDISQDKIIVDPNFSMEYYAGAAPFARMYPRIYGTTLKEMKQNVENAISMDFDLIPQLYISKKGHSTLLETRSLVTRSSVSNLGKYDSKEYLLGRQFSTCYVDLNKCEITEEPTTLVNLIATAHQKLLDNPFTFMGGVIQVEGGAINLLHPLCLEFLVKTPETKYTTIWYYLNTPKESEVVSPKLLDKHFSQIEEILSNVLDVKKSHLVTPREGSGEIYTADNKHLNVVKFTEKKSSAFFLLGLSIIIGQRGYNLPWYGYQLVDRSLSDVPSVNVIGVFGTAQLSRGGSLCTGAYSISTHGGIARTYQTNPSTGYDNSIAYPKEIREAYHVGVSTGLSYYLHLMEEING